MSKVNEEKLPYETLAGILEYCPDIGRFKRLVPRGSSKKGDIAGSFNEEGYRTIWINNHSYKEHRLVWLYVYKKWPELLIDHINGNRSDNRISNLREVDNITNLSNRRAHSKAKSGYTSVYKKNSKWEARIMVQGISIVLGCFDTPEEASHAYISKRKAK